jgi:hypothetical protein
MEAGKIKAAHGMGEALFVGLVPDTEIDAVF